MFLINLYFSPLGNETGLVDGLYRQNVVAASHIDCKCHRERIHRICIVTIGVKTLVISGIRDHTDLFAVKVDYEFGNTRLHIRIRTPGKLVHIISCLICYKVVWCRGRCSV